MLWVWAVVLVVVVAAGIWGHRREVAFRRRTGTTRGERHDPGRNYFPPPPSGFG